MKNVQVKAGYVLHVGSVEGCLRLGDRVLCTIDGVNYTSNILLSSLTFLLTLQTLHVRSLLGVILRAKHANIL